MKDGKNILFAEISYNQLSLLLKKYYENIYSGDDIEVILDCEEEKKYSRYDDGWSFGYKLNGNLLINKMINGISGEKPITFKVFLSESELNNAIIESLNDTLSNQNISVNIINPNKKSVKFGIVTKNKVKKLERKIN